MNILVDTGKMASEKIGNKLKDKLMIGAIIEKPISSYSPVAGLKRAKELTTKQQLLIFLCYAIVQIITSYNHEPWMDEAQAWLLAKDASLYDIFFEYLKYEGTPGLWHLILSIPAKLGLPYYSMHIISAVSTAIGVALFLRYAPFPPIIKILYPFTFFAFYQYGVVARSYCLVAPILFAIAIVYKNRMNRPYLYMALLFILANISAHTFLLAGALAFLHFIDIVFKWPLLDLKIKLHHSIAIGVYGLAAGAVALILIPPADHMLASGVNTDLFNLFDVSTEMIAGSLSYNHLGYFKTIQFTIAIIIFLITLYWLNRNNKQSLYIFPLVLLCLLFGLKYKNLWHQGILFYMWLFSLWISFDEPAKSIPKRLGKFVLGMMIFVLAIQVYWGAQCALYDISRNYSGSKDLVKYIKKNGLEDKKIFSSGWKSASILPYFDKNIFYNYNEGSKNRFWIWSNTNKSPTGAGLNVFDSIAVQKPDMVIFASHYIPSSKVIALEGYKKVNNFKGFLCWKSSLCEPECFLVFRKIQ